MKKTEHNKAVIRALEFYNMAKIVLTQEEKENIEIADMGLNDFENFGLALVTFVNTEVCCAKEMVLTPYQICPEHRHPPVPELNYLGKEETFRCRFGKVYLYVEGEASEPINGRIPEYKKDTFSVFHEIELNPGEQYTLLPNTLHWFQAGSEGAVISEFSTKSLDEYDIFTDKSIVRAPVFE